MEAIMEGEVAHLMEEEVVAHLMGAMGEEVVDGEEAAAAAAVEEAEVVEEGTACENHDRLGFERCG
ncbi:hypothetical protein M407DRAFT_27120 [Tulasnella calospora MUT 4182]|uniref:Uncharacterized protein n=1 Tax=Tulasnella calospora MUT 4182 TaxID=1051891 RepID=A0A0C3QEI5_9AGAM|nr:hypothetical protein M407DRAFT_27120 [Tulasnella calospora MUT 4182]